MARLVPHRRPLSGIQPRALLIGLAAGLLPLAGLAVALSAELREIAAVAGAEAAHGGHEEAGPADLLTALYVWDERIDGPLRKSTGVTARLLRPRAAGGGRRRGQMVPLSSEAADLF